MPESQDTEVTLGTGRLLGLFFGLVVICALFFSLGFSLGRKSAPTASAAEAATAAPAPVVTAGGGRKPSSLKGDAKSDCPTPDGCPQQAPGSTSDELTFYKAVEQNDSTTPLQPAPKENPPTSADAKPAPEMSKAAQLGPGYLVQVAAVSKQEDAEALVAALRKKQYPVFSTTVPTDRLFHVQVGPFSELKDAEAVKVKLVGDGYNPIVKR